MPEPKTPHDRLMAELDRISRGEIDGVTPDVHERRVAAFERFNVESRAESLKAHLVRNVLPEATRLLNEYLSQPGWIPEDHAYDRLEGDHVLIGVTVSNQSDEHFANVHIHAAPKDLQCDWSVDFYLAKKDGTSTRGKAVGHHRFPNAPDLGAWIERPGEPCTIDFGIPEVAIEPVRARPTIWDVRGMEQYWS